MRRTGHAMGGTAGVPFVNRHTHETARTRPGDHVHVRTARGEGAVCAASEGNGIGPIVVFVMARRHLTSVQHDGPEAPKKQPVRAIAPIRRVNKNNITIQRYRSTYISCPHLGYPLVLPHTRVRLVAWLHLL